jgi:hypothetical protein
VNLTSTFVFAASMAAGACTLTTDLDGLLGNRIESMATDATTTDDASGERETTPPISDGAPALGDVADVISERGDDERYRAAVLSDLPVGYWRLGETSDIKAKDEVAAHEGTYTGSVTRGLPGAIVGSSNTAARFDQGGVTIGDYFDFAPTASYSLEAWIMYDHAYPATGPDEQYFVAKLDPGGGYHLYLDRTLVVAMDRASAADFDAVGIKYTTSTMFHHVVATFNGSTCRLFLDGIQVDTGSCTRSIPNSTASLTIGTEPGTGGNFQGVIDEVAIYDRALDVSRILAHFDIGQGR